MKIIIILYIIQNILSFNLFSQDINSENYSVSIGLGGNISSSKVSFSEIGESKNCCPNLFENSYSNNFIGEISYRKFFTKDLAFFINFGLINYNDNFNSYETQIVRDELAKIKHSINLIMFRLQNRLGLSHKFENIGISYGILSEFNLIKKYDQKEELIEPLGATFENDLRIRNVSNNLDATYIKDYAFSFFSQFWYEFYLSRYHLEAISPYIELNYSISDIHEYDKFKKINLIFGFQIRFISIKDYDTPLTPSN